MYEKELAAIDRVIASGKYKDHWESLQRIPYRNGTGKESLEPSSTGALMRCLPISASGMCG